jgi:transcriptional regulator with XRE-family HTH domain
MSQLNDTEELAKLIRDLRKHKNLTIGQLAAKIDRSLGFVSQIERGLSRPTVADLTAISEALGVPTTYFYSPDKPRELSWVTRPDERRTLYYADGVTDVLVSPSISAGFSMLESFLQPGASSGAEHLDDSSEQGGFVLEGELSIWHNDSAQPVILKPGDSFQLPAHSRFRYANQTDSVTRVLWVFR